MKIGIKAKNSNQIILVYLIYRFIWFLMWFFEDPKEVYTGWIFLFSGLFIIIPASIGYIFVSFEGIKKIKKPILFITTILLLSLLTNIIGPIFDGQYHMRDSLRELFQYLCNIIKDKEYLSLTYLIDGFAFLLGILIRRKIK